MSIPTQNTNQFEPTPAIGQPDMQLVRGGGALAMMISSNQATALYAGSRVKLDPAAVITGGIPQVIACGDTDSAAIGTLMMTSKQSSFVAGDVAEVLTLLGPITWQVAAAAIAAGAKVEMAGGYVQTKNIGITCGIALEPAVADGFVRIAGIMPLQA